MTFRNLKRGIDRMVIEYPIIPAANQAHQTVTIGGAVYTLNIPQGVARVMVQALVQNVRYTLDGTAPTTVVGFQFIAAAEPRVLDVVGGRTVISFFEEVGGAILEIQYLE